jgi:hypothetical protein
MDVRSALVGLTVAVAGVEAGRAQCAAWGGDFGIDGISGNVLALHAFDDGTGNALYVGGGFTGGFDVPANNVLCRRGQVWSALGTGVQSGLVYAIADYDDGTGPALYVAGSFTSAGGAASTRGIAKWDGSAWSSVGGGVDDATNFSVRALCVYDDGGGPQLYTTGLFASIGGVQCYGTARWNGATWSALGVGIGAKLIAPNIGYSLQVYDDGTGESLFVGGLFDHAGPVTTGSLARWNAQGWSTIGGMTAYTGPANGIRAMTVFDDGGVSKLVVAGDFTNIAGVPAGDIAGWNGNSWSGFGSGVGFDFGALAVAVFDNGNGPRLFASGHVSQQSTGLFRWNGTAWQALEASDPSVPWYVTHAGYSLADYDDGSGSALFIGGDFFSADGLASRGLARWKGGTFGPPLGPSRGIAGPVYCLLGVTNSSVPSGLYAGGYFSSCGSGSGPMRSIARWDGTDWQPLASGIRGQVFALLMHDDGSGLALYAAGAFTQAGTAVTHGVARWNGTHWSKLAGGVIDTAHALAEFDDGTGPALFAAGVFTNTGGGPAANIAEWDGTTWTALGSGVHLLINSSSTVRALAVFDDGYGAQLYVGGDIDGAGGISVGFIARWNGASWSAVGSGLTSSVTSLLPFDDGTGAALYASTYSGVMRWRSGAWTALPTPNAAFVAGGLAVYDDGSGAGRRLHAAGPANSTWPLSIDVARWNGSAWTLLGAGADQQINALASYEDGSAAWPQLFIGGTFSTIAGREAAGVSRLADPCVGQGTSYCTAGTTASGCQALMSSTGNASRSQSSGFVLRASSVEPHRNGLLIYGTSGPQASPYGTGTSFRCVKPPLVRTFVQSSGGMLGACDGTFAVDFNAWMSSHPLLAPAVGGVTYAQAWFRDPGNGASQQASFSDGLRFVTCP